jgi:stage II sporulation protein D
MYEGKPIIAYYHSTTDGMTEVAEEVFGRGFPYLKSVPASGKLSPLALWTRKVPLSEVSLALGVKEIHNLKPLSFTSTGRVNFLYYDSSSGIGFIKAKDLRRKVGWKRLPSTSFSVKIDGDKMLLNGRGFGHGVGLSQWSALEMALEGKKYTDILSHFYPGAELKVYEGI